MRFNRFIITTLFLAELRMLLRDRRVIFTSIILPLMVMPILLFGSSHSMKQRVRKLEQTVCHYTVTGSQSQMVHALLTATRERLAKTTNSPVFQFDEKQVNDARAALSRGELQVVLEGLTAAEARAAVETNRPAKTKAPASPAAVTEEALDGPERPRGSVSAPVVRLVFRADRDDSTRGMHRLREELWETRQQQRADRLRDHGFPVTPNQVAEVKETNLASKGQVAGLALGRTLTLLVLLFMLSGGAVVAIDSLAGEKERGTLETLLTTSAARTDIIAAKSLVILAVAFVITLIQAGNLLVYVGFKFIPVPLHFAAAVPPGVALLLLALFLPVAALTASVLLLMSGYAKTYKEAQLYFFPVFMLAMAPAMAPFLPGLPLRSAVVVVPVANIALTVKEVLIGSFDWPMIAIAWLTTALAAAWVMRLSIRFLSAERLIAAVERDAIEFAGGPALFGRHVLRWFAVLWAVLLMVGNYTATADLRLQLLINLVGLFFGTSMLMLWWYRLDPRQVLAWRLPHPMVWVAMLLAIPGGILTGVGVFHLASRFFPVSREMIEGFGQSVVPADIPFYQLLFFLTVLPGVFEEITFRGVLLHGLHRRLHPAALTLVVGLVFGLFHMALFRLAPTAFLGALFAVTTLLTGSIFPTMLWHACNNALGVMAEQQGVSLADLEPSCYGLGVVMLAAAFWLIWRHRTPYPGLRPWTWRWSK